MQLRSGRVTHPAGIQVEGEDRLGRTDTTCCPKLQLSVTVAVGDVHSALGGIESVLAHERELLYLGMDVLV